MVALPFTSNSTVISWHNALGGTPSSTVTSAVQVDTFSPASVTVSVTVVAPRLMHVKAFGVTARLVIEQLSVLPPSTSIAAMLAFPVASNCIVMS